MAQSSLSKPNIFLFTDLFDSHCHLSIQDFAETNEQLVQQAVKAGVQKIIDVAIDLTSAQKTLANSQKYPKIILPTIGLHPELVIPGSDIYDNSLNIEKIQQQLQSMKIMLSSQQYFMIGECGIDSYWLKKQEADQAVYNKSLELQTFMFERQVKLAEEFTLPLTIHQRDSLAEILPILEKYAGKIKGVLHSFTGSYAEAQKIFSLGFAIGINGIITYNSAENLRKTVKKIIGNKRLSNPVDLYHEGIYLETDSPFLIPRKVKSKYNSPQNIKIIWEFIQSLN